ncbi:hypothetical protein QTP81_02135 [Alteromonas sp. ASW11-36]|uniref:Uncharacterized protein n=1 Tax=Alteromonas arenosi TaxID=3055817 RepID=A0ABT7ST87_9ALTE|nr:hypothetical protein [Alteromonas sp. ASW11-36]MDM7859403.1 hypothetical protein [Alteromonas sp. ASW11-36]
MGMYFVIKDLTTEEELYDSGAGLLRDTLAFCERYNIEAPFFYSHDFNPEGTYFHKVLASDVARQLVHIVHVLRTHPEQTISGFNNDQAQAFFADLHEYCVGQPTHIITCYTVY